MIDDGTENIFRAVQRKYPVCTVIDARTYDGAETAKKCSQSPVISEVRVIGKKYNITLCTGSFNVYVLKIEEQV